jgi:hypothetical protein
LFAGITANQLKFARNVNNLDLSLIGNSIDKLTIKNWYLSSANQIEEFRLSDGSKILASQVNSLVAAMAAFGAGSTTSMTEPTAGMQTIFLGTELVSPWAS